MLLLHVLDQRTGVVVEDHLNNSFGAPTEFRTIPARASWMRREHPWLNCIVKDADLSWSIENENNLQTLTG